MPRTTSFALRLAACTLGAAIAAPALAAEEDTQLWTTFTLAGSVAPRLDGGIEVSPRARSEDAGGDQVLSRVLADYRLTPSVMVGGGLTYLDSAGSHEWRPHQQLLVTTGPVTFRTRLEERFVAGADRMELRLRQRVQVAFALDEGFTAAAGAEVLALFQARDAGEAARLEQWRAQFTLRKRIAPQIEATAGYLVILSPREGRADRLSHVPQIAFTLRP